jgi:hypothetical protein
MSVIRLRNYRRFIPNQQIAFNGTSAYAENHDWPWPTGPITIEFWNFVASTDVQQAGAFGSRYSGDGKRVLCAAPWSNGKLIWDYGDYTQNGRIETDYTPYLDKWTHVAVQSEGAGGTYKSIILNGQVIVENTTVSDGPTSHAGLRLGRWSTYYHKGKKDELRVWKGIRRLSEIQDNMYKRMIDKHPDLITYYTFDTGDAFGDSSDNNYKLTNYGAVIEPGDNPNFNY